MNRIIELTESIDKLPNENRQLFDAIGYLSTWSINSSKIRKVILCANLREQEMIATYWTENAEHIYTIGAVFSNGRVSFHS